MTARNEEPMTDESPKTPPVRKKPAVKKAPAKKIIEEPIIITPEPVTRTVTLTKFVVVIIWVASISLVSGYFLGSNKSAPKVDLNSTSTFTEVVAGRVALTEQELTDAVKKLGATVYWAGPVKDAKYTLSVPGDGQAYVRYLPNGKGIEDTAPNYVVIATYATANAFEATQSAANSTSGVTFINPEGAAVYYNKSVPTNVYVAYPGKNYQIEIFDPIAKTALEIASRNGALKVIS
jgi:hypothetical protein